MSSTKLLVGVVLFFVICAVLSVGIVIGRNSERSKVPQLPDPPDSFLVQDENGRSYALKVYSRHDGLWEIVPVGTNIIWKGMQ